MIEVTILMLFITFSIVFALVIDSHFFLKRRTLRYLERFK
jgi:hypothetical protein